MNRFAFAMLRRYVSIKKRAAGILSDLSGNGIIDRFVRSSQTAASKLSVKSALNPMLWLCGIISLPCFALATFSVSPDIARLFIIIGFVPIGVTCLGFSYFAMFRPEKLQSEEYQLRQEAIDLIRQKGSDIAVSPSSLEAIANPAAMRQVITDITP